MKFPRVRIVHRVRIITGLINLATVVMCTFFALTIGYTDGAIIEFSIALLNAFLAYVNFSHGVEIAEREA